jgi:hypothetical protein
LQIPKYIEIRTAAGEKAAFLSPKTDKVKNTYLDYYLNGESKFEFMIPATSKKLKELVPECQIWAGGKVYSILNDESIDIVRDEKGTLWAKVMAVERWAELDTQFPEPYITNDPNTPSPADLAVIIVGGGSNLSGGLYQVGTAGHALYACLKGSGWSVGIVDVPGIHDLEMEKTSRLQLVKQIQNIWGGYLVWDSVNKSVSLRDPNKWQNYTGFQIRYKKNLKNITRTQSNRIITKLFCFGKDDLDIASVNGGKKYVTNFSYTSREYTAIYRNPDIDDPTELMNSGIAELSLICHPKYLYKVKIADLRILPAYSHEDFTGGDMADVIDPDVAPDSPRPRIVHHKYNLFQPWDCELDIGDPEERLVEMLKAAFGTSGYIDVTLTSRGQLSGYKLVDGSVDSVQIANAAITSAKIQDAAITTAKIDNLAVTNAKIQSISADKITAGRITATIQMDSPIINGGTINGVYMVGGRFQNVSGTGWLTIDQAGGNIADFNFRVDTSSQPLFTVYNDISGVALKSMGYYILGAADGTTSPYGTWNCSGATFSGLNNGSSFYATQEWVTANFAPK